MNDPFVNYLTNLQNNVQNSDGFPKAENNIQNDFPNLEQIGSATDFNAKASIDGMAYNNPNNLQNINNNYNNNQFININPVINNNNQNFNFHGDQNLINNKNFNDLSENNQQGFHNLKNNQNDYHKENSISEAPIPAGNYPDGVAQLTPDSSERPVFKRNLLNKVSVELGNLGEPAVYDEKNESFRKNNSNLNQDFQNNLLAKPITDGLNSNPPPLNYNNNNYQLNNNDNVNGALENLENNVPLPQVHHAFAKNNVSGRTIESVNQSILVKYCSYHSVIFALGIVITVLAYILLSKMKYSEGYFYQDIYKSWNSNLISEISNINCQSTIFSLIQEEWPGTKSGCHCYTSLRPGTCGRRSPCLNVRAIDPIPISFWRGMSFCRQSGANWQNKSYLDLNISGTAAGCPVGSRSCGLIDSNDNHLCVENNISCPINSMKFYNSKEYEAIKNTLRSEDKIIIASNGVLIYSNKDYNDKDLRIPIDFKISNDNPCLNPYYENIGSNIYVLDIYAGRNFCFKYTDSSDNKFDGTTFNSNQFFFDNHYKEIDSINMEDLYIENGITQVTNSLPLFPVETYYKRPIKLYSRNYFGLKIACLNKIKKNNMADDLKEDLYVISKLIGDDPAGLKITVILMMFFIFLLFFLGITINMKNKRSGSPNKIDMCSFCIYFIFSCIAMAFLLVVLISISVILSNVRSTPAFDLIFSDLNCVDSYGLDLYEKLIPNISFVRASGIACVIMCAINLFLLILFSCFGCYKSDDSLYD